MTARTRHLANALLLVGIVGLLAAGCGDDDESSSASTTTTTEAPVVTVTAAWARTSPSSATNGAAYMTLRSNVDNALTGVSVPSSVAGTAQMHETVDASMTTTSEGSMGSTESTMAGGGEMAMQEVETIDLPAGKDVVLEPGGYHIMLMELASPLEAGTTIPVALSFAGSPDLTIDVEVRDTAP